MKKSDRTDLNGIVVVNKPSGMTSHDVVSIVRKKLDMKRIGHAGTLDPLATGVLVLLIGKGTKFFERCVGFDKAYRATMMLGRRTTTADIEGQLIDERPYDQVTEEMVRTVFCSFLGVSQQLPPMVSAIRVNGRRLYELGRKGLQVDRPLREIRLDRIELLRFEPPYVEFILECSKGTYVRAFAEDVGEALGCGACISQIERLRVGPYGIDTAVDISSVSDQCVKAVAW